MNDSTTVNVKINGVDNTKEAIESAKSNFSGLWKSIGAGVLAGNAIQSAMNLITGSVGDAIKRVDTLNNSTRAFSNMGFSVSDTKQAMDALDKSIRGLPTSLNDAVSNVELFASSTNDVKKSQEIFSAVNDAILGFGGTSAMVTNAVQQMSQGFSNGKIDGMTWISMINSGLGPALGAIAKDMGVTTGQLKSGLSDGTISVQSFQDELIKLNTQGGGGMQSFSKIAKDSTSGIGTGIENAKTAVVRGMANIIQAVGTRDVSVLISNMGKTFEGLADDIAKVIDFLDRHRKAISEVIGIIGPFIGGILAVVVAMKTWQMAINALKAAQIALTLIMDMNPIILAIMAAAAVALVLVTHWKQVKQWFSDFVNWLKDNWVLIGIILLAPFLLAPIEIYKHWEQVKNFFKQLPGEIKSAIGDMSHLLFDVGKDMIKGLINGIKDAPGAVGDAIKGIGNSAVHQLKGLLGIHSPSTVFAEIGQNMGAGLIQGIQSIKGKANMAVSSLATGSPLINSSAGSSTVTNNTSYNTNAGTTQTITIGQVILSTPSAANEFFKQIDRDTQLQSMGITPSRGIA